MRKDQKRKAKVHKSNGCATRRSEVAMALRNGAGPCGRRAEGHVRLGSGAHADPQPEGGWHVNLALFRAGAGKYQVTQPRVPCELSEIIRGPACVWESPRSQEAKKAAEFTDEIVSSPVNHANAEVAEQMDMTALVAAGEYAKGGGNSYGLLRLGIWLGGGSMAQVWGIQDRR